jgi:hypothetical protein
MGPLLFTPDACGVDLRCFRSEEMRSFLTRDDLSGFTQQVMFVDACAAFEEQYRLEHGTVPVPFPERSRREVDQFLLYAARDGQEAEHDDAHGTGVFSRAVLDWLEMHAPDLRPDLPALELDVRSWFEEQYRTAGTRQTPVAYRYRALDGTQDFGTTFARADHDALLAVAETLSTELGQDEGLLLKYAGRVAKTCGLAPSAARDPVQWFARALLHTPRTMATFIETLVADKATRTARKFLKLALVHGTPGLLSVQEHTDLESLLGRVPALSPAMVNRLTRAATSAVGLQVTADGGLSLAHLMKHIERLEEFPGGVLPGTKRFKVPAVVAFTQYLALHTCLDGVSPALRMKLVQWGDRVAGRLLVAPGELQRVREQAEDWDKGLGASRTSGRIVVQIHPGGHGGQLHLRGLDRPRDGRAVPVRPCGQRCAPRFGARRTTHRQSRAIARHGEGRRPRGGDRDAAGRSPGCPGARPGRCSRRRPCPPRRGAADSAALRTHGLRRQGGSPPGSAPAAMGRPIAGPRGVSRRVACRRRPPGEQGLRSAAGRP